MALVPDGMGKVLLLPDGEGIGCWWYHGTVSDFTEFSRLRPQRQSAFPCLPGHFFFTPPPGCGCILSTRKSFGGKPRRQKSSAIEINDGYIAEGTEGAYVGTPAYVL